MNASIEIFNNRNQRHEQQFKSFWLLRFLVVPSKSVKLSLVCREKAHLRSVPKGKSTDNDGTEYSIKRYTPREVDVLL